MTIVFALMWRIWIARNLLIFERKSQSAEEIVTQAVNYARDWQTAQQRKSKQGTKTPNQFRSIRQIPRGNWTTCKSDAAWKEENKVAGLGWVIYNGINTSREKILLQGASTQQFVKSPLSVEGLALLTALHKAKELGINNLIVISDSQQLIKTINKEISTKELHGILHDILDLALVFEKLRSLLMAAPSSSSSSHSRNWLYDVFPSFRGEDVRVAFLSHFLKELDRKLISAFKDSEIERSRSLDPELKNAIRDSRIAVVIFSTKLRLFELVP
ncbi:unnamed protein product [Microthlaspi erraticum]|uniref:TIR domain-containing protein n=1 Tax=Microthlaspi erraticum TaxID=1685480 RepID=A0A6D2KYG4_9BRAS|nr:unnamed protein product [Microthlaspi erraticum]